MLPLLRQLCCHDFTTLAAQGIRGTRCNNGPQFAFVCRPGKTIEQADQGANAYETIRHQVLRVNGCSSQFTDFKIIGMVLIAAPKTRSRVRWLTKFTINGSEGFFL